MLEDLGSLTVTSGCIFSSKRFVKKNRSLVKEDTCKIENDFLIGGFSSEFRKARKGRFFHRCRGPRSAIGVDVAAEDDDVGPSARLVSSPEEEGA